MTAADEGPHAAPLALGDVRFLRFIPSLLMATSPVRLSLPSAAPPGRERGVSRHVLGLRHQRRTDGQIYSDGGHVVVVPVTIPWAKTERNSAHVRVGLPSRTTRQWHRPRRYSWYLRTPHGLGSAPNTKESRGSRSFARSTCIKRKNMVEDLSDLLPICPPSVDLREREQQPPVVPERPAGGWVVGSGPPAGRTPAEAARGGDLGAHGGRVGVGWVNGRIGRRWRSCHVWCCSTPCAFVL